MPMPFGIRSLLSWKDKVRPGTRHGTSPGKNFMRVTTVTLVCDRGKAATLYCERLCSVHLRGVQAL